eukprot:CAMPEP_0172454134 /NCGR_PEP_ID=MMETSP1065-20121228/11206_1 /TAXON_ID=265537 /ORGANISM="Amphiprora paludosa, Strain CCMP125" /LENGTH=774 /DNA_ID=CAMNT_0013206413 /DNA_START=1 /DNA_END=2325 /DNA_ORIENTATION=+
MRIDSDLHSLQEVFWKTCQENNALSRELAQAQYLIQTKNALIETLQAQLSHYTTEKLEESSWKLVSHEQKENDLSSTPMEGSEGMEVPAMIQIDPSENVDHHDSFNLTKAVDQMHDWFFPEEGRNDSSSVKDMIQHYSTRTREELQIPLDRYFTAGLLLHPRLSAHIWKWEPESEVEELSFPRHIFDKSKRVLKEATFRRFYEGEVDQIRIRASETDAAPLDCLWFKDENYTDYFALPFRHNGEFMGGMAWATKEKGGFSEDHIQFFEESIKCFSMFLRLHKHDMLLNNLHSRLEDEVTVRTRDLSDANEKIMQQSAAQLKNFACMSHEIRTPLNCIIGLSSLLIDTDLDENQEDSLRMIVRSGDLLLSVVNDVLDYSRLESGNIDINEEPTDIKSVFHLVHRTMATKASARGVRINKSFDRLPSLIKTDGSRIQQILYNLLGNAVKFSRESGSVEFDVKLLDNTQANKDHFTAADQVIRISVKDYGKGIAASDLANIFEPFNQGSNGTARAYGGTGLGLAICANLVKGLNGTISVDSVEGEWSEFVVCLPCIIVQPDPPESNVIIDTTKLFRKTRPSGSVMDRRIMFSRTESLISIQSIQSECSMQSECSVQSSCSSGPQQERSRRNTPKMKRSLSNQVIADELRILVVDDNMINRKVLVRMLHRIGAKKVDTAENGLEACNKEAEIPYDLILMDMEMPVMDGLEATRKILSRHEDSKTPPKIVFVTAHALDTFHAKAVDAGGCGFLTKPFNLKKLTSVFNSVDMHLGCRQVP